MLCIRQVEPFFCKQLCNDNEHCPSLSFYNDIHLRIQGILTEVQALMISHFNGV